MLPHRGSFSEQPHYHLLSFDPRATEDIDDLGCHGLRNFNEREPVEHFDIAKDLGINSCFVGNGTDKVVGRDA